MSQYLPFWPKGGIAAYAPGVGQGNGAFAYSKALPTNGFTEVIVQFQSDVKPGGSNAHGVNTGIKVIPQISNDAINWEDNTDATLDSLTNGSTVPFQDTKKFTTIGAFMRMKIELYDTNAASLVAGTILIAGAARS